MSLTEAQRAAVADDGHLALVSCPGSGKTRTLVAKLARCVAEVVGTPRMVACITYTNAAVAEVVSRVERLDIPGAESCSEVETIHSFCLKHIFGTQGWRLPPFENGFRLLTPDDAEYTALVKRLVTNHGLNRRAETDFEQVTRGVGTVPDSVTRAAAVEYWEYLDARGATDFSGIIYWSRQLVQQYPFIARGLASRYAWILVDEFQDTSQLQVDILRAVHSFQRARFFIVGDPYQSIMSVNGADPHLMSTFADEIAARTNLQLLGNFRSTRKIIELADLHSDRGAPMEAMAEHRDYSHAPEWLAVPSIEHGVVNVFVPTLRAHGIPFSDAAVLAPWWTTLPHLARALRGVSVPVLGPGARPYRRTNHVIAPLVEELAATVSEPLSRGMAGIRRELRRLLASLSGGDQTPVGFRGDVLIVEIVRWLRARVKPEDPAKALLTSLGDDIVGHLSSNGFVDAAQAAVLRTSAASLVADIARNETQLKLPQTTVATLGLFSRGSASLRLSTMHAAKGREWAAVAVVDVFDGRVPHFTYQDLKRDEAERQRIWEEGRRVFYVALTRAKKLLLIFTLAIPGKGTSPSPFLLDLFPDGPVHVD
jgi:DNA helicase-2/ATP-dependent DNA helicase PcrA